MEALHANYYGRKIKSRKKVLGRRKGKTPAKKKKKSLAERDKGSWFGQTPSTIVASAELVP